MSEEFIKPNDAWFRHLLKLPAVDKACEHVAQVGVEYAKSIAPVDTGAYRDSIHAERHEEDDRVTWQIVASDRKAEWIEYGTENTPKDRILGRTEDYLRGHDAG